MYGYSLILTNVCTSSVVGVSASSVSVGHVMTLGHRLRPILGHLACDPCFFLASHCPPSHQTDSVLRLVTLLLIVGAMP